MKIPGLVLCLREKTGGFFRLGRVRNEYKRDRRGYVIGKKKRGRWFSIFPFGSMNDLWIISSWTFS